jgi:hypothetical protein
MVRQIPSKLLDSGVGSLALINVLSVPISLSRRVRFLQPTKFSRIATRHFFLALGEYSTCLFVEGLSMIAVLLLVCIALSGFCVRLMIDAVVDIRRSPDQRLHHRKNPRFLIWGATGFLFSSLMLLVAFPLEPALALIGLSWVVGTMTAIAGKFKILGWE